MIGVKTESKIESSTTFDLRQFANDSNGYDQSLPHPMTHKVEIISTDGNRYAIMVGQIESILKVANIADGTSYGKFIDHCYKTWPERAP